MDKEEIIKLLKKVSRRIYFTSRSGVKWRYKDFCQVNDFIKEVEESA